MHVDAVRAAVDLRDAELGQVKQLFLKSALMKVFLKTEHRFVHSATNFSDNRFSLP